MNSRFFWSATGVFIIALLWFLSLIPQPPHFGVSHEDKYEHLLAYGGTMWWWAQLWRGLGRRALLAIGLTLMGVAIEFVQGWTGWRQYDVNDMIANGIGVLAGWVAVILWTRLLPNLPWYTAAAKHHV